MLVGSVLMSVAVVCSPFWQAQPYMAAGIIIGAVALPFYALHLSRRIEKSREHAETKARHFRQAASTDPLTGLLNRRGFNEVLEQHISSAGTSALLYIDLDGFKGDQRQRRARPRRPRAGRRRASPARLPARQRPGRAHRR